MLPSKCRNSEVLDRYIFRTTGIHKPVTGGEPLVVSCVRGQGVASLPHTEANDATDPGQNDLLTPR